jgi:hypothetical protein
MSRWWLERLGLVAIVVGVLVWQPLLLLLALLAPGIVIVRVAASTFGLLAIPKMRRGCLAVAPKDRMRTTSRKFKCLRRLATR